jgi:DNA-binding MarR family transcriptional regulator
MEMFMNGNQKNQPALGELLQDNYGIWGLYVRVERLVSRARKIELAKCGITPEQSHVLHILEDYGGASTMNEIASISMVHHNAVSTLISRMEKLQLVKKCRLNDPKQYQVSITEKGHEIFTKMPKVSIEMAFSDLSEAEKKALVKCLSKLENRGRHMLGIDYRPPFLE